MRESDGKRQLSLNLVEKYECSLEKCDELLLYFTDGSWIQTYTVRTMAKISLKLFLAFMEAYCITILFMHHIFE